MTVNELAKEFNLNVLTMPNPDKSVDGAYCGDLLSWVMGRAKEKNIWITIMSNINVIAVATLVDVSCVVFAEGVVPPEDVLTTAETKGVNLLYTDDTAFGFASKLSGKSI